MTKLVHFSTQWCDCNTDFTSKIQILLTELDVRKMITWNYHVDESQGKHKYDMILGRDIFSELKIVLYFYNNTIWVDGGAYEVFTSMMKSV